MVINYGKLFEKVVKEDLERQGEKILKVPQDIDIFKGKVIRRKTAFDFVYSHNTKMCVFDAKVESEKDLFNFKSRVLVEGTRQPNGRMKGSKIHQWNALQSYYDTGHYAGYLIWFQGLGYYVWADVLCVRTLIAEGVKSLHPESDGVVAQKDSEQLRLGALLELRNKSQRSHR